MKWWARLGPANGGDYGRWVPTGCNDKNDAKYYITTIYRGGHVIEWLMM